MRRKAERNATGLARRFSSLAGLKLLLADELRASALARTRAMAALEELSQACRHRPDTLVEQVVPSLPGTAVVVLDSAACILEGAGLERCHQGAIHLPGLVTPAAQAGPGMTLGLECSR